MSDAANRRRSAVLGYLTALCCPVIAITDAEHSATASYQYIPETQTLIIQQEDDSLSHTWNWTSMQMDVRENG